MYINEARREHEEIRKGQPFDPKNVIIPYIKHKAAVKTVGLKEHVSTGINAFLSICVPLCLSGNQLGYDVWSFNSEEQQSAVRSLVSDYC